MTCYPFPDTRMVEGEGFEPSKAEPADLQSAPFDRSGTPPTKPHSVAISVPQCQTASGKASTSQRIRYEFAKVRLFRVFPNDRKCLLSPFKTMTALAADYVIVGAGS